MGKGSYKHGEHKAENLKQTGLLDGVYDHKAYLNKYTAVVPTVPAVPLATVVPVVPLVPVLSEEELLLGIAPLMYSYHTSYDDVEASDKQQQAFMAYNGLYVRRVEKFNDNVIASITKALKVPGLRSASEGLTVTMVNKLPFSIYLDLVANFRAIHQRDATESSAQVYRNNDTKEYFVHYPVQNNSGANTNYSGDADAVINLRQKHTIVLEAHSHANFGAFFSGGDDANEKAPLAYCVIGNVSSQVMSFKGRVKLLDQRKEMDISELFEVPEDINVLDVTKLTLPEPSPTMLANAKPAALGYLRTVAELAEERLKNGIVIPIRQPLHNYTAGRVSDVQTWNNQNLAAYYGYRTGDLEAQDEYEDWRKYARADSYVKETVASVRGAKNSIDGSKLDMAWFVSILSKSEAIELAEKLAIKLEVI